MPHPEYPSRQPTAVVDGGVGRTATVVGGGPAGLIAAETLARAGVAVTVVDRMPSVLRKFLLAGHGGLNITHSEDREAFLARYGPSADRLATALERFGPQDLRDWCAELGEETFVGSSRRVFPRSFRANPLVRAWRARLADLGVVVETRRRWVGWSEDGGALLIERVGAGSLEGETATSTREVRSDVVVLALGGGSWARLGSDGSWTGLLERRGVAVAPLRAANVGLRVAWTPRFVERFAGAPLKNVALAVRGSAAPPARGDAMLTAAGIEGGPVYALGVPLRQALDDGACVLEVDLRPDLSHDALLVRLLQRRSKDSTSSWLRRSIGLDAAATALLWEGGDGGLPTDAETAARLVKAVPVVVTGTMPVDRAISTAGGVAWSEVDERLMLRAIPGAFLAGEMLDWEAPTGGYLLQACFSTGVLAAEGALAHLGLGPVGRDLG